MTEQPGDGRTARRLRSREAVIEAFLSLTIETGRSPSAADIAARSGVSLRSVHLHLADADFMSSLIARSAAKDMSTFQVADLGNGPLAERIDRLVSVRVKGIAAATQLIRASVTMFDKYPDVRANYDRQRSLLRMQTKQQFSIELARLTKRDAEHLHDAIDVLTQIESVRYQLEVLGRTPAQTIAAITSALHRLLSETTPTPPTRAISN